MLPVKRYKINLVHQILNSGTDARKLETTFSKPTNATVQQHPSMAKNFFWTLWLFLKNSGYFMM